jgi:ring-1,2-phenylacetyl-CoA epoxidase subunit PaaE
MQFHHLTIRQITRETPDCVSIAFDVPEHLAEQYRFKPGQYLTLKADINGTSVRRSYSICAAPHENDLRVAVKLVQDGVFSTYANRHLQVGDTLECGQPDGRFILETDAARPANYVAFAAGSGITPIISILKSVLNDEPQSRFVLFYGNRGFDHIIFREQLEWLKNRYPDRLAVHHVFSRESMHTDLYQGHLDGDKCHRFGKVFFHPPMVDQYFICGPAEMIFGLKDALKALGVEDKRVKFELFAAAKPGSKPQTTTTTKVPTLDSQITVIQDGLEFEFNLPSEGSTLLDAAMRAGADLPFSCKGGVCSTCKAKVLEGTVEMELNYGLEPDEVAAGYVLTCQAHPRTDRVVVSFDA